MKTPTFIWRKLDELSRVVIPRECLEKMGLDQNKVNQCEITIEYGKIHIRKFDPSNIGERPFIGIVRCTDPLMRVCLPKEYIRVLGIATDSKVKISLEGESVVISQ